jgi:hypothetical protein
MADEKILKEDDEEEKLIVKEVEKLPKPGEKAEEDDKADDKAKDDEEDDEDDEDEKLAGSQDDEESEVVSAKRKRRHKRREMQRRAREQQQRELRLLREENMTMTQRLAALEGHSLTTTEQAIEQRLREALNEAQQAETIMARAIEAGQGADAVTAQRIRDEARDRARQLQEAGRQIIQKKQQVSQPAANPRVASLAQEWIAANPWYDPNGRDEDSRITKAIDDGLIRDGYDPAQPDYWQELTSRVSRRLNGAARDDDGDEPRQRSSRDAEPRRKVVPSGNGREHASEGTRKEVSVTPERKAAMIEAGVWDDPKLRNRYLKSYQKYDRQSN